MQVYDIIMIVVLIGATLFGFWKGLAWQVASLSAIFVSYFVAVNLRDPVARVIGADPPWNVFLAMLILYVGSSLLIWIMFRLVADFIDRVKLKEFDRQIGALFGLAKGIVLCVIVTLFAVTLLGAPQREAICQSRSGYYIALLLTKAHGVMPDEIHEVVGPYLHTLNEKLEARHHDGEEAPAAELDASSLDDAASTGQQLWQTLDELRSASGGDSVKR